MELLPQNRQRAAVGQRASEHQAASTLQHFMCGLVAGTVAKLATHPLDVAKKRYQVRPPPPTPRPPRMRAAHGSQLQPTVSRVDLLSDPYPRCCEGEGREKATVRAAACVCLLAPGDHPAAPAGLTWQVRLRLAVMAVSARA